MNVAIIIAGGVGSRMGQDIPKQFIKIYDKPILIYTLEGFEKNEMVDAIEVVCIESWIDKLKEYIKEYNIHKVKWIVKGGTTGQESIRNGVYNLKDKCSKDDIAIIHDGIRPIVDDYVLEDVINTAKTYGNGVTSLPYNEQIFVKKDDISTDKYIPRDTLRRVSTPQAYRYEKLLWGYEKAFKENIGISGSSYTNTMMVDLGERLYFAKGSDRNIKLTTPDDIYLFKALLALKDDPNFKK